MIQPQLPSESGISGHRKVHSRIIVHIGPAANARPDLRQLELRRCKDSISRISQHRRVTALWHSAGVILLPVHHQIASAVIIEITPQYPIRRELWQPDQLREDAIAIV